MLPGGIFNKGYVRAYARHLGIDEEQAVADYLRAAHEAPPDVRLIAHQNSSMHSDANRYDTGRAVVRRSFPVIPLLILVVVIVGAVGGWRLYRQRQRERAQSNLAATQTLAAKQTTGAENAGSTARATGAPTSPAENPRVSQSPTSSSDSGVIHTVEAAESASHSSGPNGATAESALTGNANTPFAVTVRAKDRARVEVKSDGEVVVRGVIEPSEVKTFHASSRLVFWTANAGQVEISFNGKSVPISGGENDERILVFNSRGLVSRPAAQ